MLVVGLQFNLSIECSTRSNNPLSFSGVLITEIALVQVTYNKDSKDITVEDSASSADPVCGEYECSQYVDNGNGNDWHYVTVTQEEKGYKWSNRAGVSWMLDAETLDIGDWAAVFKLNPLLISLNQNCLSYGWVAQLRTMNKTQLVRLIFIPMFSCYIPKLVQKICQNLPKSI